MEYLDTYDENKNFLGSEPRDKVHKLGLWHNTIHCWLYDTKGNVYFQKRKDSGTFYTTASGHVSAGESIKEGFGREIKEEIGIDIEYQNAILVKSGIWKMDKKMPDGTTFKDRAFSNVYVCLVEEETIFKYDPVEVDGILKVRAQDALELFKKEEGKITAKLIYENDDKNNKTNCEVEFSGFLVNDHETAIGKYGYILDKIIELTSF